MQPFRVLRERLIAAKPDWLSIGIILVLFLPPVLALMIVTAKRVRLHFERSHYTRIDLPIVDEIKEKGAVPTGSNRWGYATGSMIFERSYYIVEDPISGDRLRLPASDELAKMKSAGKPLHFLFNPQAPAQPLNRRLMREETWISWKDTIPLMALDTLLAYLLIRLLRRTTLSSPSEMHEEQSPA